jgi:hypothetical protein
MKHETTLKSLKAALKKHTEIGVHLKAAYVAMGGVVNESGDIVGGGDNTTQQPSRSIYSWMGRTLEKFYLHQDKKHKLDRVLASIDPDSKFGRQLKCERELAEIQQDLALDENRRMKFELHERWRLKDDYARFPLYTDLELYRKKPAEKRQKDPWATYRLF